MMTMVHRFLSPVTLLAFIFLLLLLVAGSAQAQAAFDCTTVTDVPVEECNTLVALFNATDGAAWTHRTGWLENTEVCTWFGVGCTNGRVAVLWLTNNNLNGTLPTQIGQLTELEELHLAGNRLTGVIPSSLGSLVQLRQVYLGENQLTGGIPTTLGALPRLEQLGLQRNQLSGGIPAALGGLTALRTLDLGANQLTGNLPAALGSLSNVTHLLLWGNRLSGTIPPSLCNATGLQFLGLSDNQLTGAIPSCLGNLANLESIYLGANQLTGALPIELSQLSALRVLQASNNQLSGPIPEAFGNLAALEELHLAHNQLYGFIPPELGQLSALRSLDLGFNLLSGSIPASFGNLTNLEELALGDNNLFGALPAELGNLTHLRALVVWSAGLSGVIPPSLGNLSQLQQLYLNNNRFSGSIPAELGNLTQVMTLTLNSNELTGTLPGAIGRLANLRSLHIDNNRLTGWLPTELGQLTNLIGLYGGLNGFYGPLPTALGNLTSLETLDLGKNQLTGPLPSSLANLSSLRELHLYDNQLSGSLPEWIGDLRELRVLNLGGNRLTGALPSSIGQLTNLREIHLSFNLLSGAVPATIGNLANLEILVLWVNNLSGDLPASLGQLSRLWLLGLSENQFIGAIPPQLGNLTALRELHLHTNRLTGAIPAELGNLASLETLWLDKNALTGVIPAALVNLGQVTTGRFGYNMLTATDTGVRAWLTRVDLGWAETQTVPPTAVQVRLVGSSEVEITWTPILYQDDGGGYRVDYGLTAGAPYTQSVEVAGKDKGNVRIGNLIPGKSYHFVLRSVTPAHADDNQQNDLISPPSEEVSISIPAAPTNTPTPTVDIYEPDNSCPQAKPIATDGTVQFRTLDPPNDEDWIIFQLEAGAWYMIEAMTPPESAADLILEQYNSCTELAQSTINQFGPGVVVEVRADTTGSALLRLFDHNPARPAANRNYRLSVRRLPETPDPGVAVIVAGYLREGDFLQTNIYTVTNTVYQMFLTHGYPQERIYYLAPDLTLDPSGDGQPDVRAVSSVANLEYAITRWAVEKLQDGGAFTLYLMDHGERGVFYLNGRAEILLSTDLNPWLRTIEQAAPGTPINVIIEACKSGSFIRPFSISAPGRTIITSTNDWAAAHASQRGGATFSDAFIAALNSGLSVWNAFDIARNAAAEATKKVQQAQLDADGDGVSATLNDIQIVSQRGFTYAGTFRLPLWQPPYIEWADVLRDDASSGSLRAYVLDNAKPIAVTVYIYPPDYTPPADAEELVAPDVPSLQLTDGNNDSIYVAQYDGFTQEGAYRVVFMAVDVDNQPAMPVTVLSARLKVYLPAVTR